MKIASLDRFTVPGRRWLVSLPPPAPAPSPAARGEDTGSPPTEKDRYPDRLRVGIGACMGVHEAPSVE
jgi:hypothetical protein